MQQQNFDFTNLSLITEVFTSGTDYRIATHLVVLHRVGAQA